MQKEEELKRRRPWGGRSSARRGGGTGRGWSRSLQDGEGERVHGIGGIGRSAPETVETGTSCTTGLGGEGGVRRPAAMSCRKVGPSNSCWGASLTCPSESRKSAVLVCAAAGPRLTSFAPPAVLASCLGSVTSFSLPRALEILPKWARTSPLVSMPL